MIIDSHVNLHAPQFAGDREAVIDRARQAGVGLMLTIFTDSLEEEVAAQRFFEQGSALLRSGLMTVDSTFGDI